MPWINFVFTGQVTRNLKSLLSYLPIENVANLFPNVLPESEELAIDPMQGGLEKISFSRILAIKQAQQL